MDHSTNQIIGKVLQNQAVGETVEISGPSKFIQSDGRTLFKFLIVTLDSFGKK